LLDIFPDEPPAPFDGAAADRFPRSHTMTGFTQLPQNLTGDPGLTNLSICSGNEQCFHDELPVQERF
jgi:hypothetical protein